MKIYALILKRLGEEMHRLGIGSGQGSEGRWSCGAEAQRLTMSGTRSRARKLFFHPIGSEQLGRTHSDLVVCSHRSLLQTQLIIATAPPRRFVNQLGAEVQRDVT